MSRAASPVRRNVLCIFPHYSPSFGTFENAYPFLGVKAFMPPQGILVIANYLPENWSVRFVDENVRRANAADFAWADVVFASGMHIQRPQICDINRRAHEYGKVTALGGPSVSGCPEYYPDFDYLHVGEVGDATDALIARLGESVARPPVQVRFETKERLPLADFPVPAYTQIDVSQYFLGSVQFSSGCPYRCDFCDIPELYGNNPRLKTPEQIVVELDAILANGGQRAIYFVDDNFVGNRKAAKELLPHLIAWQKKNGYAVQLACEATLNIAKSPELLEMMREAYFCTIFCGIETPDPAALKAMHKEQNNMMPIMEAIGIIHSYGMEVVSGIIMGLDTDTPDTAERILEFVELSNIPLLTINLLQALPRTPIGGRRAPGRHSRTRIERRVQVAVRSDDRDVAPHVHRRLQTRGDLSSLRLSHRARFPQPDHAAEQQTAPEPAQHPYGAAHFREPARARRLTERLSRRLLENGPPNAGQGRCRSDVPHRDGEPSPHHVRARSGRRPPRRIVLQPRHAPAVARGDGLSRANGASGAARHSPIHGA